MKVLLQVFLIVLLSFVGGVASTYFHSEASRFVASSIELNLDEVDGFEQVFWVDARTNEDFEAGHLEGAILLNEEYWEEGFMGFMMSWMPEVPVVVYCSSRSCARSHEVARRLREELGVDNVYALKGGWEVLEGR